MSGRARRLFDLIDPHEFPEDVVLALLPLSGDTATMAKRLGCLNHQIVVEVDIAGGLGEENTTRNEIVDFITFRLSRPPKRKDRGYVIGSKRTADVVLPLQNVDSIHFRFHFHSETGILVFTDESRQGIHFVNSPYAEDRLAKDNQPQIHLRSMPLDSKFEIGKIEESIHYLGFVPGTEAHQSRRREYLSQYSQYAGFLHSLSPPEGSRAFEGYQNWGSLGKSYHHLVRLKDGIPFAGKMKCSPGGSGRLRRVWVLLRNLKADHVAHIEDFLEIEAPGAVLGQKWSILITEFCPLGDLTKHDLSELSFPEHKHFELMKQLSLGLGHIHSHDIIHGALKKNNILVASLDPLLVKITGFENSRIDSETFEPYIKGILDRYRLSEYQDRFILDSEMGLIIENRGGNVPDPELWDRICDHVIMSFPPGKEEFDPEFEGPELTQAKVTVAADIWSLGMIDLSYYQNLSKIHTRCFMTFSPYHEEVSRAARGLSRKGLKLLDLNAHHRSTAAEAATVFSALQRETVARRFQSGTPDPATGLGSVANTEIASALSPRPPLELDGSFEDPYAGFSPSHSQNQPLHIPWDVDSDTEDDPLKFRFKSVSPPTSPGRIIKVPSSPSHISTNMPGIDEVSFEFTGDMKPLLSRRIPQIAGLITSPRTRKSKREDSGEPSSPHSPRGKQRQKSVHEPDEDSSLEALQRASQTATLHILSSQ